MIHVPNEDRMTQQPEEWQFYPLTPGYGYEVSTLGQVRSVATTRGVRRRPLMLRGGTANGYRTVKVAGTHRLVHVMVLETFVGPRPPGTQAAHRNGNRLDNTLVNLEWKTPVDNEADKLTHGTALLGERANRAKLTKEIVEEARRAYRNRERSIASLAREHGVHPKNMARAINGVTWKHLKEQ